MSPTDGVARRMRISGDALLPRHVMVGQHRHVTEGQNEGPSGRQTGSRSYRDVHTKAVARSPKQHI